MRQPLEQTQSTGTTNGQSPVREKLSSLGFKIADETDPIYQEGLQISVSPSSGRLGTPFERLELSPDSLLDLQNLPVDPAQEAGLYSESLGNQTPPVTPESTTAKSV